MPLGDIVYKDSLRFILSGGKGGVGKTSCAAAMALLTTAAVVKGAGLDVTAAFMAGAVE